MPDYLIDSTDGSVVYHEPDWFVITDAVLMGASEMKSPSVTTGTFTVSYSGAVIRIWGHTPPGTLQQLSIAIDGTSQDTSAFLGGDPHPTIKQLYVSPAVADGNHAITIGGYDGGIDFMVYTTGRTLAGLQAIVDSNDFGAILYQGSWNQGTSWLSGPAGTPGSNMNMNAYGGGTRNTNSVGASATFNFVGTSVSVFGVLDKITSQGSGNSLSVSYILDGSTTPKTYTADTYVAHFQWFGANNLAAKEHTLKMVVTQSNNVNLNLDYILYSVSGSSPPGVVAPPPSQTGGPPSSVTGSLSGSPSSSPSITLTSGQSLAVFSSISSQGVSLLASNASGSITGPLSLPPTTIVSTNSLGEEVTITFTPQPTSSTTGVVVLPRKSTKTPIIGAIIGGVLGLLLIILILLLLRRRYRRRRRVSDTVIPEVEPFNGIQSSLFSPGEKSLVTPLLSSPISPTQTYHKSPVKQSDGMLMLVDGTPSSSHFPLPSGYASTPSHASAAYVRQLEDLVVGMQRQMDDRDMSGGATSADRPRAKAIPPPPYTQAR